MKRSEPIGIYDIYKPAVFKGEKVIVLLRHTYCCSCDRFLDEAEYSVQRPPAGSSKLFRVKESELEPYYENNECKSW